MSKHLRTTRTALLSLGLVLASSQAAFATNASDETWVEPHLTDCEPTTPIEISPEIWTSAALASDGLDGDTNDGTGEDGGGDASDSIFGSIRIAEANTNAGGTIHIPARGVYRDSTTVTITDSLTVHGYADADVILSGDDCFAMSGTSATTAFTIDIGDGETVVLENLDFRRYSKAIDLTSASGATLIVRNCTFHDNTTGLELNTSSTGGIVLFDGCTFSENTQAIEDGDGGGPEIRVVNCRFEGGSYGIRSANGLSVANSSFIGQSSNAIEGAAAQDWHIASSRISGCGNVSISAAGAGTGTHTLSVTDTHIDSGGASGIEVDGATVTLTVHGSSSIGNAGDGIRVKAQTGSIITVTDTNLEQNDDDGLFVQNTMGCTSPTNLVSVGVMDSRLSANGDDGIEIGGTGTACSGTVEGPVECGIVKNTIVGNGGHGIVETTSSSTYHCGVGANMLSYNVAGAESGTGAGACTAGSVALNQIN